MIIRIITVNLPLSYLKAIKALTGEGGLYPSRSELIRVAVREFLIKELEAAKSFAKFQQQTQTQFSAIYPPKIEEHLTDENLIVKVPLNESPEGIVTEYKTYKIVQREQFNSEKSLRNPEI